MRTTQGLLWLSCVWLSACDRAATDIERHRRDPGRQLEAHAAPKNLLDDRVADMPPAVLSYLIKDGARNGFPGEPRVHSLNPKERAVVAATFAALPPRVRSLAEQSIVAIYFVDDLGSSAWTEYFDPPGRQSFMVFDALVLRETPNAWATRKERSAFAEMTDLRLEIADPKDEVPGGAFRFIFLHELGHAVAYARRLHPTWVEETTGEYPFAKLAARAPQFESGVRFYATPAKRLSAAQAKEIYARWNRSEYPTLSATVGVEEDFAETFVSYVHTQLLQQPYRVFVDGARYENGLLEQRGGERRAFVAALFTP